MTEHTSRADPTQRIAVGGSRRAGPYQLLERVGEGGMGVVWRAEDPQGRVVAVKVLRPHIAHDAEARERLRREVSTLARVHHDRVASVIDADVDGESPYIVTEFVDGPPLDAVVDRRGPMDPEDLLRLGRGLAAALHAIHDVGIVHRDLKPGNVLLRRGHLPGTPLDPVVIDFGIAQVADDVRLTSTGLVMGTPGYLSPELADGGRIGPATDWWGWAATLAYAASGEPPFGRGPVPVVLDRVMRGRFRMDGVDARLRPLLEAALDPEPARRPGEQHILDALERYAEHRDVTGALPLMALHGDETAGGADATRVHERADATRVAPVWREPGERPRGWEHGDHGRARDIDREPGTPERDRERQQAPARREPEPYRQAPEQVAPQPQPGPRPQPYAQPYHQPDPRIGRSPRTGTLAALLTLFTGLAALVPVVAWGALALWGVTARTVDRQVTGLVLRRHEVGPRRSDIPMAVLSSPWHLLAATIATGLSIILPLAVALITAVVLSGLLTTTEVAAGIGPDHPWAIAAGSLLGGWLSWWGLGSTSLRRGSRTLVRSTLPAGTSTVIGVAAFLAAAAVALWWAATGMGDLVSWWPFPPGTGIGELLQGWIPGRLW